MRANPAGEYGAFTRARHRHGDGVAVDNSRNNKAALLGAIHHINGDIAGARGKSHCGIHLGIIGGRNN